jgi:hypothetical protein
MKLLVSSDWGSLCKFMPICHSWYIMYHVYNVPRYRMMVYYMSLVSFLGQFLWNFHAKCVSALIKEKGNLAEQTSLLNTAKCPCYLLHVQSPNVSLHW